MKTLTQKIAHWLKVLHLMDTKEGLSGNDDRDDLEENSKEDTQGDGLMTLDESDILFPEEF